MSRARTPSPVAARFWANCFRRVLAAELGEVGSSSLADLTRSNLKLFLLLIIVERALGVVLTTNTNNATHRRRYGMSQLAKEDRLVGGATARCDAAGDGHSRATPLEHSNREIGIRARRRRAMIWGGLRRSDAPELGDDTGVVRRMR